MKSLSQKMISTNIGDMVQINETMANFEKMFNDLDVNSNMMNEVFDNVNVGTTNEQEVNKLVNQVAEANGMKVMDDLDVKAGEQPIQQPVFKILIKCLIISYLEYLFRFFYFFYL